MHKGSSPSKMQSIRRRGHPSSTWDSLFSIAILITITPVPSPVVLESLDPSSLCCHQYPPHEHSLGHLNVTMPSPSRHRGRVVWRRLTIQLQRERAHWSGAWSGWHYKRHRRSQQPKRSCGKLVSNMSHSHIHRTTVGSTLRS